MGRRKTLPGAGKPTDPVPRATIIIPEWEDDGSYDAFNAAHHAYLAAVAGADDKVSCPGCGPEGVVLPILVNQIDRRIFMCDECECVWSSLDDVGSQRVWSWTEFARRNGIPDSWADLTIVMPS